MCTGSTGSLYALGCRVRTDLTLLVHNERHTDVGSPAESGGVPQQGCRLEVKTLDKPADRTSPLESPNLVIFLHIAEPDHLELRLDCGRWRRGTSRPGCITIVPAGRTAEWMWDRTVRSLRCEVTEDMLRRLAPEKQGELLDRFTVFDARLESTLLGLHAESLAGRSSGRLRLDELLVELTQNLWQRHSTARPQERGPGQLSRHQLALVLDYIHANTDAELSLVSLAAVVGHSVDHFRKAFANTTGAAPHAWVLRHRVSRAQRLLLDGTLSTVDVAQLAGFYDQSHMSNAFRRQLGLTPAAYRRRMA